MLIKWETVWTPVNFGKDLENKKFFDLLEFEPRTITSVASRYTDYGMTASFYQ